MVSSRTESPRLLGPRVLDRRGLALAVALVAAGGCAASIDASGTLATDVSTASTVGSSGAAEPSSASSSGAPSSGRPPTPVSTGTSGGATAGSAGNPTPGGGAPAQAPAGTAPAPEPLPNSVRYYVSVGQVRALEARLGDVVLGSARAHLVNTVGSFTGVAVSPVGEARTASAERIRGGGILGVMIECSVVRLDVGPQGTRAAVSLVVANLASADIVATMQGGALAQGQSGPEAEGAAIAGAIEAALRGLPRLLDTLARR